MKTFIDEELQQDFRICSSMSSNLLIRVVLYACILSFSIPVLLHFRFTSAILFLKKICFLVINSFHYFIQLFVFSWSSLRYLSMSSLRSLNRIIIAIWSSCLVLQLDYFLSCPNKVGLLTSEGGILYRLFIFVLLHLELGKWSYNFWGSSWCRYLVLSLFSGVLERPDMNGGLEKG